MPIRLTSRQYRVIAITVLAAAISMAVATKYFERAFPEASINFQVDRDESTVLAEEFLAARAVNLTGYMHAARFGYDDDTKLYLERTQGLEKMQRLIRGPLHLWRWEHRWFKPRTKEEFRVAVTPKGEVVGYDHEIAESARGANLDQASARPIAESFLTNVMKRNLAGLEFVEDVSEKRPARTDHSFVWKQKSVDLGEGSLRIEVEVDGNRVAGYREFVKIPEQWTRDYERLRSRNDSAQIVDQVLWFLLTAALLGLLIRRLRDRDAPLRLAWTLGATAVVLQFLSDLNSFSVARFDYPTIDPYSSFLTNYAVRALLVALGMGTFIFILVAGSEPAYREGLPKLLSLRNSLSWRGLRTRSFFIANVVGIGLTFVFFAYQTVFYLTANKLGAWAPSDVNFSNDLNTRIPWVAVLLGGFFPAVSEEMQFRAFAIPFLKKLVKYWPVAIVLAAFNWGFLHSAYPNEPFFIRGLEVGLGGIVIGVIMMRFGLAATLIWHYSVDALYTAFVLLRSPNHYLMVSGALTAGIMLVPLGVALGAYLATGTFVDESALTNGAEGISRASSEEAVRAEAPPLVYRPLSRNRLFWAGVVAVAFAALACIHVYRFGEGLKVRVDRSQAVQLADQFLASRSIPVATYHHVVWLRDNLDPTAVKYLFEHETIEKSDQIYRQATRPVLWEVRYYRPLQKEEHLVFVDPNDARVFAYRDLLDEDAPGKSLSPDEARSLSEDFIVKQGYSLFDFDLESSSATKRKAREDYTLTFQAKAWDPRNVADAHYRLQVEIAGDQVVGFVRLFKLPEDWVRHEQERGLINVLLSGIAILLGAGVLGGLVLLFVHQVRHAEMRWRRSAVVGGVMAVVFLLSELNQLPVFEQQYNTSLPEATFRLFVVVSNLVVVLLIGLLVWVLVTFATSLYPNAWRFLDGAARRVWRRDALVAVVVSLATGLGIGKLSTLLFDRYHALAPAPGGLAPGMLSAFSPAAGVFLPAVIFSVTAACFAGLLIALFGLGWSAGRWTILAAGVLVAISLGPSNAHSIREFLLVWTTSAVPFVVAVALVALLFRDNVLAYVAVAFCSLIGRSMVDPFSEPSAFARWNGVLLAALAAAVLAWMFLPRGRPAEAPNAPIE